MKTKSLNLVIASVFAFVFLISFASAALTISNVPTLDQNGTSATFTISSDQNETVTFDLTDITSDSKTITFTDPASITINDTAPQEITINYSIESGFDFEFRKTYKTTLTATGNVSGIKTQEISFEETNFCEDSNPGNVRINIKDMIVREGYGKDDEWLAFDQIEIELDVENKGNEDLEDVKLEWGLYNTESDEWAIEVDEEDEFNLKEDKEEEFVLKFTMDDDLDQDLEDLEDGDYVLYVRATGEMEDSKIDTCHSDSENVKFIVESDFVIVRDIEVPETLQCDADVAISADVWNVGDDDQDEVEVRILNAELGIDQRVEVGDIDTLEKEDLNVNLKIPSDVDEGTYELRFIAIDEDGDVYENDFDDEESVSKVKVKIQDGCSSKAAATISAVLESGGEAGKPLIVKSTIANTGTEPTTYLLNAAGYADWATAVTLSQTSATLNAGQSTEITITLDVNKEVVGDKIFNLEVLADSQLVANQPVQVSITKKSGIAGISINKDNWHLWGIGFLNVILVLIIIIVAVRIARK